VTTQLIVFPRAGSYYTDVLSNSSELEDNIERLSEREGDEQESEEGSPETTSGSVFDKNG
jgi:hypothetical protein